MFRIGFGETMLVILVILVVVRPKDLPAFVRKIGKIIGQIRASYASLTRAIREMDRPVRQSFTPSEPSSSRLKKSVQMSRAKQEKQIEVYVSGSPAPKKKKSAKASAGGSAVGKSKSFKKTVSKKKRVENRKKSSSSSKYK